MKTGSLAARHSDTDPEDVVPASDERIHLLIDETIRHAVMAKEAGFDGVDIKACHGNFSGLEITISDGFMTVILRADLYIQGQNTIVGNTPVLTHSPYT